MNKKLSGKDVAKETPSSLLVQFCKRFPHIAGEVERAQCAHGAGAPKGDRPGH